MLRFSIYILALLYVWTGSLQAAPLVLSVSDRLHGEALLPYMQVLEDREQRLTPDAMLQPEVQDRFQNLGGNGLKVWAPYPIWLRLVISNPESEVIPLALVAVAAYTDSIDYYKQEGERLTRFAQRGDRIEGTEDTYRLPLVKTEIEPGEHVYYLRILTDGPANLNFRAWHRAVFNEQTRSHDALFIGLLFGFVAIMIAYNSLLAIRLQSASYAFYVAYIFCFVIVQFCFTGTAQHLLPAHPLKTLLVNQGLVIFAELCAVSASLFAIRFLNLREQAPRLMQAIRIYFVMAALNVTLCFFNFNLSITLVLLTNAYISTLLIVAGIKRCSDRYRPAYFYLAAWAFIILGSMFTMGRIYGLLPDNLFTAWSQFIGGAIEVFLLSLALGDKISLEQQESTQQITQLNEDLSQANLLLQEHIENVEAMVEEKTRDIRSIMQHIPIGVFMIKADETIHKDYSNSLEAIVQKRELSNSRALDLIFARSTLNSDEMSQATACIQAAVGEHILSFEINSHLLPLTLHRRDDAGQTSILDLTWNPIANADSMIEKILVTMRDVTTLRILESRAHEQKDELDFIAEIIKVPSPRFLRFIQSCRELLQENSKLMLSQGIEQHNLEVLKLLFINLHTIKGAARSLYLKRMTRIFHDIEQYLVHLQNNPKADWDKQRLQHDLDEAKSIVSLYETIAREKLGRSIEQRHRIDFDLESIDSMYMGLKQLAQRAELPPALQGEVEGMAQFYVQRIFRPVAEVLQDICGCLPLLAKDLHKELPEVQIETQGILLNQRAEDLFQAIFVHVLRNAMDHGIEAASERQTKGKNPRGCIRISMEKRGDTLKLDIADDGRGLPLKKIFKLALARGSLNAADAQNLPKISMQIFEAGLSTSNELNDISGRGMGMNAVRRFIEDLAGHIVVNLHPRNLDEECCPFTFTIELPFYSLFELPAAQPERAAA